MFHYYFGKGEPANIGDYAFEQVKKKNDKIFNSRIKTGLTDKAKGNYSINMTKNSFTFFIGRTVSNL